MSSPPPTQETSAAPARPAVAPATAEADQPETPVPEAVAQQPQGAAIEAALEEVGT